MQELGLAAALRLLAWGDPARCPAYPVGNGDAVINIVQRDSVRSDSVKAEGWLGRPGRNLYGVEFSRKGVMEL